ncbi:MAG: hypothetical protein PF904_04230 [Kiritimatiellae bacterium]|jgi:hypothetical protein|nr:hypothetical protein [Kiritimatiellia bacterium]
MKSNKSEVESNKSQTEGAVGCGEECTCHSKQGGRSLKLVLTLSVAIVAAGILIYKNIQAENSLATGAADNASKFSVAQNTPNADGNKSVQSATTESAGQSDNPEKIGFDTKVTEAKWLSIKTLSDLNTVAANQDAVFIFVPQSDGDAIADSSLTALTSAQASMQQRKITVGLYTLTTGSPDYSGITAQALPPAILVASKGGGMSMVSGEINETKLLQAFMATQSSGCGPASCGAGGCK